MKELILDRYSHLEWGEKSTECGKYGGYHQGDVFFSFLNFLKRQHPPPGMMH